MPCGPLRAGGRAPGAPGRDGSGQGPTCLDGVWASWMWEAFQGIRWTDQWQATPHWSTLPALRICRLALGSRMPAVRMSRAALVLVHWMDAEAEGPRMDASREAAAGDGGEEAAVMEARRL